MLATLVPHVAVQLLLDADWGMAAVDGTAKPRVSCGGTEMTSRVVPPVESLTLTLVYVAEVLVTMSPYRSAEMPVPAAVMIVVSAVELAIVVCWLPSVSRARLLIMLVPFGNYMYIITISMPRTQVRTDGAAERL